MAQLSSCLLQKRWIVLLLLIVCGPVKPTSGVIIMSDY